MFDIIRLHFPCPFLRKTPRHLRKSDCDLVPMRTQWMTLSRLSVPMSVTMKMIVMESEPLHPLRDSGS